MADTVRSELAMKTVTAGNCDLFGSPRLHPLAHSPQQMASCGELDLAAFCRVSIDQCQFNANGWEPRLAFGLAAHRRFRNCERAHAPRAERVCNGHEEHQTMAKSKGADL